MSAKTETLAAIRWKKICAACAEGTPPERCAYYGEPDGCNAPVRGHHPAGDVAERLKDELADAHDAIARLEAELAEARRERDTACAERALSAVPGNAAAMRAALEECRDYLYDILRDAFHDAQVTEQDGNPSMAGYEREQKLHKAIEAALAAPPHKGRWKNGRSYEYEYAYCSECGRMQWAGWDSHRQAEQNIGSFADDYRFCPGCGAEMEGGEYVK